MINSEVYDRLLNSLSDTEKSEIKELNKKHYIEEENTVFPTENTSLSSTEMNLQDQNKYMENKDNDEILQRLKILESRMMKKDLDDEKSIEEKCEDSKLEKNQTTPNEKRKHEYINNTFEPHNTVKSPEAKKSKIVQMQKTAKKRKNTEIECSEQNDIEKKKQKLDLKRKLDVAEEVKPDLKRPKLNLKRKNHFPDGNPRKMKKLSFNLWK